jgi:hypothetical protein
VRQKQYSEVARRLGVSRQAVWKICQKRGIAPHQLLNSQYKEKRTKLKVLFWRLAAGMDANKLGNWNRRAIYSRATAASRKEVHRSMLFRASLAKGLYQCRDVAPKDSRKISSILDQMLAITPPNDSDCPERWHDWFLGVLARADGVSVAPYNEQPKSWVYVIQSPYGQVKIGIATNLKQRIRNLQTSCAHKLILCHAREADNASEVERALHVMFADSRLIGEWFQISPVDAGAALDKIVDAMESKPARLVAAHQMELL